MVAPFIVAPAHLEHDGGDGERADDGGDERRVAGVGLACRLETTPAGARTGRGTRRRRRRRRGRTPTLALSVEVTGRALDLFDGEVRRQHPQHLGREQAAGEHRAGRVRRRRRRRRRARPPVVAQRAASSMSWVARTTAPPPAACSATAASKRVARLGVHAPGWLVEQEHVGAADGHGRDGHPLALAAREAARVAVRQSRSRWRRASHRSTVVGVVTTEQPQRLLQLAADGRREQERVRVLGDVGDGPRRDRSRRRDTVWSEASDAQQRGLARSVPSEQRDDLALGGRRGPGRRARRRPPSDDGDAAGGHEHPSGRLDGTVRRAIRQRRSDVRPRLLHRQRRRLPAEQPAEAGDARRAGVGGEDVARAARRRRRVPSVTITARSASGAARSRRCSARSTVVPRSALRRPMAASTSSAPCGSSCDVGSSSTRAERRGGQRAGDGAALALAARQRGGRAVAEVGDVERVEHLLDPAPHRGFVGAEVLEHEGEVGLDLVDDELRLGVLVHEPDDVGHGRGRIRHRRAAEGDDLAREAPAGGVGHQSVGGAQQRALPGARRTGHEQDLVAGARSRSTSRRTGGPSG